MAKHTTTPTSHAGTLLRNEPEQFSLFRESEIAQMEEIDSAPPVGRFSNFIVYVDESGDHGMQTIDQNYPVFVLAFCIFYKGHYCGKVVPALEKFKFNHFGHDHVATPGCAPRG